MCNQAVCIISCRYMVRLKLLHACELWRSGLFGFIAMSVGCWIASLFLLSSKRRIKLDVNPRCLLLVFDRPGLLSNLKQCCNQFLM